MKKYFKNISQKCKVNSFTRKLTAFLTAIAVILASLPLVDMSDIFDGLSFLNVKAAAPRHATLTYNDLTDFAAYSINYSTHSDEYCEDVITLALNQGAINTFPSNYIPLGTEAHPFNGKIYINQTYGSSWWFETEKPLFDYIADSAVINYLDASHNTEAIQIELRRKENSEIAPLFANHVTEGGSDKATWKVKSAVQQQNAAGGINYLVCNYSGLIGSMDENSSVTVEYENSAYHAESSKRSDVVSSDSVVDVGLVCGTMENGSAINLTLSGTNTGCFVESTSGNAGGLIGKMKAGSALNIYSTYEPSTSRNITASNGYAGGIVGYNDGGIITFSTGGETKIKGTITGKDGAGGIYGYYSNYKNNNTPQAVTIDLKNYDINCTAKATDVGGIAGIINGTASITVDGSVSGSYQINITGDTVTDFGGICGNYRTSSLTNTFSINTVTANTAATFTGTSYYGGVTGVISGNNASYVNVNAFTHKSSSGFDSANAFGGVVGNAGDKGSMLDVGTVTVETGTGSDGQPFNGGGIVGILNYGVLRLSGTTNLQKAPANSDHNYGQLVGIRKDSLVYAAGSGSDSGWMFNRSNTDVHTDDIGTWGSVIRTHSTNLPIASLETQVTSDSASQTSVLEFNTTAHTVRVAAHVTPMTSAADFTKTALNMQLKSADKGSLKFAGATARSTLLGTSLTVSGTIDLSGTGNIGLMRDDYKDSDTEIGLYTGTLSGGTVKLAVGERFGFLSSGSGRGAIVTHRYNGLLARTGANAAVSGLTVDGTINVYAATANTLIGGIAAEVTSGISLSNVTSQETINFHTNTGSVSGHKIAGMVGYVSGGSAVGITTSNAKPKIVLTGTVNDIPVGGAIGSVKNAAITATTVTVSPEIDASGATAENMCSAGLISHISGSTVSLTGVTVTNTKLKDAASNSSGGFLGMNWYGVTVTFNASNGVVLSGTNTHETTAKFTAGLVYRSTGHWTVPNTGISITGMSITDSSLESLGIIVHDGYSGANGLYLELTHKDSYNLGSGLTIPLPSTTYDELVAVTGSNVLSNSNSENGKGVISITTDGDLIMDGTSCNTYQNKYNQSMLANNKSRYYYNITGIAAKASKSDGEKLLLWSMNKYAATNINSNFVDSFGSNAITGTFDMIHLSYYPIDVGAALNIGDATFTFYNNKIETGESGTGNSDGGVRSTRSNSQHLLMHSGLFRNVSSTVTTSGNIHYKGDIGVNSTYSGVLISGTLSGTLTTANNKEIVFEGLTLSDSSKYLFINKLTTNSKMTLSGVRTGGGKDFSNTDKSSTETAYSSGATVASSLIGDVSGNGIQVTFDRMKLDSRTIAGSPADLSSQYGTTKSIFSGATFLNRFNVDNNSTGNYNFDESEDWETGTHNANVTYGQEIKTSVEYANKQQKYLDQVNYVDPVADPSARSSVYGFDSGFLPYVRYSTATYQTGENATRELKVNVFTDGLSDGCGTYNHPYEITLGTQLVNVATSINKTEYFSSLRLPKINCNNNSNLANLNSAISEHWCDSKAECAVFTHNAQESNFKYTENNTTYTWTEDQVSLYLASAYYVVKNDIYINEAFPGLGATPASDSNKTGKYAFRGVIVGSSNDGSVKISMSIPKTSEINDYENTPGLITMSNGSVVKNLTIEVTPNPTDVYNYKVSGNQAYAYDEKFPNYGAVINKIMGGDNIIDNVSVDFTDNFKVLNNMSSNVYQDFRATIGGYVGCVVNGGLIFRNVEDTSLTGFTVKRVNSSGTVQTVSCRGNTITNLTDEKDLIHIHVNPFVGRVINGYAIRESDHYAFSEDGATYGDGETRANAVEVTMHNTRKNYSIPDIDTTDNNVLTFSQSEGQNKYDTISVPDSQALYIMSIIAQSGSGCATDDNGDYAYNISYCGSSTRNYTGYNNTLNNKATHWAAYDAVGSNTKGDDYNLSKKDTINQKTAVPYIIYKYTSSYTSGTNTLYPARTLTKRTFYINLNSGTTYYLPDSFRGIGFLGSNTLDDNMKIFGFNGNGTTANPTIIDVNSEYYLHQKGNDPYFGANIAAEYKVGIGLFNNLKQRSSTGFDRKYESDSKYHITNFTLQGYLSAHHVNSSGKDQNASPNTNRDGTYMNTAGFVPTVLDNGVTLYNFSNIMFNKVHINSYAYAGGFVAYTNDSSVMIYINNSNADGYKIEGSGRVAGFVGSFDTSKDTNSGIHINTGLDSNGKDTFSSVMTNTIINNRFKDYTKHNYTAGVVGAVYSSNDTIPSDNGDNAKGHLILRNVTIEGGDSEKNYIGNKDDPQGSSGGIIGGGSSKLAGCLIQNCIVKDIDIYGKFAGGIMGEDANRKSSSATSVRIVGCKVIGTLNGDSKPQYSILAQNSAGGVYGDTRDNGRKNAFYKSLSSGDTDYVEYTTDIDGVYIYGYNIYSINASNLDTAVQSDFGNVGDCFAAGGIVGFNQENRTIQNCKVEKCVIDVGTKDSSAANTPCGGLIGRINSGTIYGYNVEVKDCDFQTHQWNKDAAIGEGQTMIEARAYNVKKAYTYTDDNDVVHNPVSDMKCGNVVGNGNSKNVNLIALHVENCPAALDFNSHSASNSFIIYADYNDVGSGSDKGTEMSGLTTLPASYSNAGEGGLKNYFPNVNVSPVVNMGTGTILTSDGAALYDKVTGENETTPTPVIDAVVNEADSNYNTAAPTVKTFIQNALSSVAVEGQPNKISTYKTEMGSLPEGVDDFTVLVINTEQRDSSTALINNYIQMATNTNYNYMSNPNWSGKYNINVYPCTYDGEKYVIGATGKTAGLNTETPGSNDGSYSYYMSNTHADSNQGDYQFSLMDVQFYNPNTSVKEIAYHLYIPILTKKMLLFEFKSASQLGTDNKAANFTNYANTLAESLDSWYTAYLHFSYGQTEINSMLESGAGLNWNGSKEILFKYQTDSVAAKLDGNTQLVLCDPNNGDKYYYSRLSDHRPLTDTDGETDTISFANFNTSLTGGTPFSPATLNDMLLAQGFTISASTSATSSENIYVVTANPAEAEVTDSNGTMYKFAGANNQGTHKLSVSYLDGNNEPVPSKTLDENYYLAVCAKGNSVYNYSIRTPATTSGGADKPTLRRSNPDEGNVTNIIMGSLYSQTVTIGVQNNGTYSREITSANHRLDVSLTSMITLSGSDSDKDYIISHLTNPNIHLYQSFIINLTARDTDSSRSEIRGTPNVKTDFVLSGNNHNDSYSNITQPGVTGTYIQLQYYDMKQYLSKNGTAMITANTQIDFDEDWKYMAEFPVQDGSQDNIGVNVSAVSNLSYNSDKMRFTNMTKSPTTPNTTYFYIRESDEASLVYNMKSEILDEYDKVGAPSYNYSQQGINPKNFIDTTLNRLPIKTAATYSATKIKRTDFINAEKIQFKLKLYKKIDDNGTVKYAEVNDVANYIDLTATDSVFIKVDSGVMSAYASGAKMTKDDSNLLTYTADIDQSVFTRQEDQRISADIDFTVITGDGFRDFANYRFVLSVDLLKLKENSTTEYESLTNSSYTHDWVVYTNAKINPNILTLSEYSG